MDAVVTTRYVQVPDARLYVEVRGSGPLLLVVGQPMTSGPFGPLADVLADGRTVVTYDPRGVGRSTVADAGAPITPEVEGDDLAAVVEALGGGPADVLGSSGGAVAALALAARHPARVRAVVAHEPPLAELLPDAPHVRRVVEDVQERFRTAGPGAAWGAFVALVSHDGPVGRDGVAPASWPPPGAAGGDGDSGAAEPQGAPPEPSGDDETFFLRMLGPFTRWVPPVETLRAGEPRLVVAVGEASGQGVAARSAAALAAQLGTPTVPFPGGHGGFMDDPHAFADALRRVLDATG